MNSEKASTASSSVADPIVQIHNLSIRLGAEQILRDINVDVQRGSIHALIGPNGAGKTTLMRALIGQMPHKGQIQLRFTGSGRIGYVPQQLEFDRSLPITVCDFFRIMLDDTPAVLTSCKGKHEEIHVSLRETDSEHLSQRKLGSLSGGEFRRVLLAQALAPMPEILLLDEPESNVDEIGARMFEKMLLRLQKDHNLTILIVSHDLTMIERLADRVTGLNRGLIYDGPPKELFHTDKLQDLFGPMAASLGFAGGGN